LELNTSQNGKGANSSVFFQLTLLDFARIEFQILVLAEKQSFATGTPLYRPCIL
jgi:hypothetical protein